MRHHAFLHLHASGAWTYSGSDDDAGDAEAPYAWDELSSPVVFAVSL